MKSSTTTFTKKVFFTSKPNVPESTAATKVVSNKKKFTTSTSKSKTSDVNDACEIVQNGSLSVDRGPIVKPETSKVADKKEKRAAVEKPKPKETTLEAEVQQLKIRFPDLITQRTPNAVILEFRMPIIDPDFPYDLPFAQLRCQLPLTYPREGAASFEILNEEIPPKFCKVVRERMNATARTFAPGELVIRPMLRYLEKNFEHFLTENAAVNRFKFFPPSNSNTSDSSNNHHVARLEDNSMKEVQKILEEFGIDQSKNREEAEDHVEEDFISFDADEPDELLLSANQFLPPVTIRLENDGTSSVRGDTFTLNLNCHRLQNIAHLYMTQISFTIKCARCHAQTAIKGLRPFVDRFEPCAKCASRIPILFEPQLLMTSNNSFGSLRIGSKAGFVDLLPCIAQICCMECAAEEDSKAVQLNIRPGELLTSKFLKCFHSFGLSLGQCTAVPKATLSPAYQRRKPVITTGVSIGSPLPLNGACQHYAKSFRWYRFPCCGRAFPCDTCHDKNVNDGHEMERARRFLCGYCSREQSIQSKRCECGIDWSKGATPIRTTHWEGGKGMRDRTAMSRKDTHKYKGLSKSSKT